MTLRSLLAALLLAPLTATAQAPDTLFNLVTLNAQAEREVPNDLLSAMLAAEAEGADPALLADEVNRAMQRALATVKSYRAVNARSGSYQTFPVYDKNRIARWRARQELRLESADFAAATELIGKLQTGMVVAGMTLSVSPQARRQAEDALIPEALAAFEQRARLVRDAMKAKSYRMRDLNLSSSEPGRPMYSMARGAAAQPMTQPSVEPGTTRILITVSGTVQLQ
jgi:predicted secreted protein